MKFYTGIGSRNTPTDILALMTEIAKVLDNDKYILRSGGAGGADEAFESATPCKRIYLPWSGFNGKQYNGKEYLVPSYNEQWVLDYHPNSHYLTAGMMKLMSRNTYQVLGDDLNTPSAFVVCWTSDGKASGGTGQALRIAKDFNIPIYNLYNDEELETIVKKCKL